MFPNRKKPSRREKRKARECAGVGSFEALERQDWNVGHRGFYFRGWVRSCDGRKAAALRYGFSSWSNRVRSFQGGDRHMPRQTLAARVRQDGLDLNELYPTPEPRRSSDHAAYRGRRGGYRPGVPV